METNFSKSHEEMQLERINTVAEPKGWWHKEVEELKQQLDGWIAANSPNGWIDNLRQQLSTLKAELKCIGEAIDDPRTDLTMTMSEIIVEQKQQLAEANHAHEFMSQQYTNSQRQLTAALAAIKVKDAALKISFAPNGEDYKILNSALAIQPEDMKGVILCHAEPVAYLDANYGFMRCGNVADSLSIGTQLYAPKREPKNSSV